LNRFVTSAMRALLDDARWTQFRTAAERFSPASLRWRIHAELLRSPEKYPDAAKYLADESRCAQLAARLAEIFDRYIWYHDDMLAKWRGDPAGVTHWEGKLYLSLVRQAGDSPDLFFRSVFDCSEPVNRELLPQRVSLFGIGAIAPLMLSVFKKLSEFTDVCMFHLNPCRQYWGSIKTDRQLRKESAPDDDPPPQTDNPLLANLGTWGRDFFENTVELLTGEETGDLKSEDELFADPLRPDAPCLLHQLQQDILDSVNRTGAGKTAEYPPTDRSIGVHSCHSRRREVEVLHDQLLRAVGELGVRPDDIIVMAPDINTYAPLIEAVFSSGPLAGAYHVSDRDLSTVSSTAENLLRILDLGSARCTATEILAILDTPAVRENFRFDDDAVEEIKEFIAAGKICWGADAEARMEFSGIAFDEFSWREGIDRLLLSFAASDEGGIRLATPWSPAGHVTGDRAELLGVFASVVRHLFTWRRFFREDHTPEEWSACLDEIIRTMYGNAFSFREETVLLRDCIAEWMKNIRTADFDRPLPVQVIRRDFAGIMEFRGDNRGYLAGGITFCSLVPMRSIPADVIAVLGLISDDFPGREPYQGLNISPAIRGERSRLLEDRYLFLETLISARKQLLLFYPGQDDYPAGSSPSAPLADLLAYLGDAYGFRETRQCRHAYAADYFDGSRPELFSYSQSACAVAEKIGSGQSSRPGSAFIPETLQRVTSEPQTYKLDSLAWMIARPLKTFLQNTTGLNCDKLRSCFSPDSESMKLDLPEKTIEAVLCSTDGEDELAARLEYERLLPPGEVGRQLFFSLYQAPFSDQNADFRDFRLQLLQAEKQYIDIFTADQRYRICGFIRQVPEKLNLIFLSKYNNAAARIRFYLESLCNAVQTQAQDRPDDLALFDREIFRLAPISGDEAGRRLAELLELAEEMKRRPVPFFAKAGLTFAQTGNMKTALRTFTGTPDHPGDLDAPYCKDFFSPKSFDDPDLSEEFQRTARLVFAPWCGQKES
ncbi:MAG: exodeoxyribonuclease V subunit gamma, partial [Lentisphaeria bacterium]|nr:exodeoxyribonuclease V subunit gamma [Lentisphaeria bacterium]